MAIVNDLIVNGSARFIGTMYGSLSGNAATATALTTNAGSATQPVYFSGGKPVATTYTLGKSVPSNAVFTDTVYTHPTTSGNKHIPSGGSAGQILRWSADGTAAWGADNNTTYSANTGIKLNGTTFQHTNSVTAATAQGDANKTLTFGGTFTIPTVTYDAQGHITGKGTTTMTMPANPNTDTKVTQTAINAADYTNWRPLIWGASNNGTEGFTPSTVTDGVYTAQTLSCHPSTGTIRATKFKGSLSGNAATATISRSLGSDDTMKIYAESSNEVNFGGTSNLSAIYFGYRAKDSKPIPSKFIFGGDGTSELVAAKFTGTLNGNAATATYTTQLLGVNSNNTPYDAIEGNLIRAVWNVKGDSRWYLKAGTYNCRVNYADDAVNADTATKLAIARTISLTGSVTGSGTFDGSGNLSITTTTNHSHNYIKDIGNTYNTTFAYSKAGLNYEEYTWLAGWNGYELRAVNKSQFAQANHNHDNNYVKKTGDTMTGNLKITNTNPYIHLLDTNTNYATNFYLQEYQGLLYLGAGISNSVYINSNGKLYGAVWNDYAEYRETNREIEPGRCVIEVGDGSLTLAFGRLQPGANIVSDTFGFAIGETEINKTPLAVSGRVLAYPNEPRESYHPGDPVCSGPNGTISRMTRKEVREYPDRIVGTVSEIPNYETWGTGNVEVNGRIWIKVK